jgi:hypothetical protein
LYSGCVDGGELHGGHQQQRVTLLGMQRGLRVGKRWSGVPWYDQQGLFRFAIRRFFVPSSALIPPFDSLCFLLLLLLSLLLFSLLFLFS